MKRYVIALLLVCAITVMGQHPQPTNKWEYKIEQKCFDEKRINDLGASGWELAGFDEQERGGWHCIFKRPA